MSIVSKNYINNHEQLKDYQCSICYVLQTSMMRCSGPCKAPLCLKCVTTYCKIYKDNNCPQRCSSPLLLEPIPNFQFQFQCPFGRKECSQQKIIGQESFAEHCRKCSDIPHEIHEENIKNDEFVCSKGHPLLFWQKLSSQIFCQAQLKKKPLLRSRCCSGCGENTICPSFCLQCCKIQIDQNEEKNEQVFYCNQCRRLPCTKEICPMGHEFNRVVNSQSKTMVCDLCGFTIFLFSKVSYQDRQCNFDICQRCYEKLPDSHSKVPLQSNIALIQENINFDEDEVGEFYQNYQEEPEEEHEQGISQESEVQQEHYEQQEQGQEQQEEQQQEQESESESDQSVHSMENLFEDDHEEQNVQQQNDEVEDNQQEWSVNSDDEQEQIEVKQEKKKQGIINIAEIQQIKKEEINDIHQQQRQKQQPIS